MKTFAFIIFTLLFVSDVQASEITGRISTDPKNSSDQTATSTPAQDTNKKNSGGAVPFFLLGQSNKARSTTTGDVKVKGIENYPDQSLLRTTDKKIFLVAGRYKRMIINFQDLRNFKGQKIYDVEADVVSHYKILSNWQLIKEKGKPKIFLIKNGKKIWIPTWAEFKRYFSGEKILELTHEEMKIFK